MYGTTQKPNDRIMNQKSLLSLTTVASCLSVSCSFVAQRQRIYQVNKPPRSRACLYAEDDDKNNSNSNWGDFANPFKAGKLFREIVDDALGTNKRKSLYFDERFLELGEDGVPIYAEDLPTSDDTRLSPEVLVVGATGQLGRVVVRKLLLDGYKVRVFVQDLYSKTLNLLGPGVTYCVGNLNDYSSIEFAVTDVDKIIFCAGSQDAEKSKEIDKDGVLNLVRAYCDVRAADYGPSQAAKRKLFKFPKDFDFFELEDEDRGQWIQNDFEHGVFYGRIPTTDPTFEASVRSRKLTSRRNSESVNLSNAGFIGIICRLVADGKVYEAFFRTSDGVEYRSEFQTATKKHKDDNFRIPRFMTVRLAFSDFTPSMGVNNDDDEAPFDASDVQYFGFRYRSESNPGARGRFYMSITHVKLFRGQPDPEFVYISDAAIPPVVTPEMVRHNVEQIVMTEILGDDKVDEGNTYEIVNTEKAKRQQSKTIERGRRLGSAETYYKYMGEQTVRNSGLNYAIVRVAGYNNAPGSDGASRLELSQEQQGKARNSGEQQHTDDKLELVSRADVAEVCVSSLANPHVCNTSFYLRNRTRKRRRKGPPPQGNENSLDYKFSQLKPGM